MINNAGSFFAGTPSDARVSFMGGFAHVRPCRRRIKKACPKTSKLQIDFAK